MQVGPDEDRAAGRRIFQRVGEGLQLVIGMRLQEGVDHAGRLGAGEGRHGVDERPAGPDAGAGDVQQTDLVGGELGNPVGGDGPAGIRMAAPLATTGSVAAIVGMAAVLIAVPLTSVWLLSPVP